VPLGHWWLRRERTHNIIPKYILNTQDPHFFNKKYFFCTICGSSLFLTGALRALVRQSLKKNIYCALIGEILGFELDKKLEIIIDKRFHIFIEWVIQTNQSFDIQVQAV
jgi:hypothetical protein